MEKGVRLIGNGQAPVHMYWEMILNDYIIPKRIDVVDLILTHRQVDFLTSSQHLFNRELFCRISIDKVAEYYMRYNNREEGLMKIFVETKFSSPPSAGAPKLSA